MKIKLRDSLAVHVRVEAEARTKNDLLAQLEADLKATQERLVTVIQNKNF